MKINNTHHLNDYIRCLLKVTCRFIDLTIGGSVNSWSSSQFDFDTPPGNLYFPSLEIRLLYVIDNDLLD